MKMYSRKFYFFITLIIFVYAGSWNAFAIHSIKTHNESDLKTRFQNLSIPFVENRGQSHPDVSFYAQTFCGTVFVTQKGELVYNLSVDDGQNVKSQIIIERIMDGFPILPTGKHKSSSKVNYFKGSNPRDWHTSVSTYNSISLGKVYNGIEVLLKAHGNNIEKLFYVHPGANPETIRINVNGAKQLSINKAGELVVTAGQGDILFTRPIAFQIIDGKRTQVNVKYEVIGTEYGFKLGAYDLYSELVIDPLMSTYLGGSRLESANAIATNILVDGKPWIYIAGHTTSNDFPGTAMYQSSQGYNQDAFIALINMDFTQSQFTYLGGSGEDTIRDMAIRHPDGDVFVVGWTDGDFPVTNHFSRGGGRDAFVARLSWDLNELEVSNYIGGSETDYAMGIALFDDPMGDLDTESVYVTGSTMSDDFPHTEYGAQPSKAGSISTVDAFAARLTMDLVPKRATYLGCRTTDYGSDIAVHPDEPHDIYVLGTTFYNSSNINVGCFPWTDEENFPFNGSSDAFIVKLNHDLGGNPAPRAVHYGGPQLEFPTAIAIHPSTGNIYITGGRTNDAATDQDAFVAYFNQELTEYYGDTYLGADGAYGSIKRAQDIEIIPGVGVYVMGFTHSPDLKGTAGGILPIYRGGYSDIFVTRFHNNLDIDQTTFVGSIGQDEILGKGLALAEDPSTTEEDWYVFVTGRIYSSGLVGITDDTAFQPQLNGGSDILISYMNADLRPDPTPDIEVQPRVLDFGNIYLNTASDPLTATLENIGGSALEISSIYIAGEAAADYTLDLTSGDPACGDDFPQSIDPSGICKVQIIFTPSVENQLRTAELRIQTTNDPDESLIIIPLLGYSGPDIEVISLLNFSNTQIGNSTTKIFQIKNTGVSDLEITGIHKTGIDDNTGEDFTLIYGDGYSYCPNPGIESFVLAPNRYCYISIEFSPTFHGSQEAVVIIFSNDLDENPAFMNLVATGVTDLDTDISSYDLDFGNVARGNSKALPLIISNTGGERLDITGIALSDPGNFLYDRDGGGLPCGSLPIEISSTSFCTMKVTFRPIEDGIFNETMTLVSNDPDEGEFIIQLTGNGVSDSDADGVPDSEESGDANEDGIPDAQQSHVASLRSFDGLHSVVIELESEDSSLAEVRSVSTPTEAIPESLEGYEFPFGFFHFKVLLPPGENTAVVTISLPEGETVDTYVKYGPEPDNSFPHYYDFGDSVAYPGAVVITDNVITLNLMDGGPGDHDELVNSEIMDPGAPASLITGDLDTNGVVDLKDLLLCLSIVVGLEPATPIQKDVDIDNDGIIELPDLIYILQKISKFR